MSRDLGDLTADEWERAGGLFELAGKPIGEDTVFVRSHQWPNADGSCDWLVFVPGTSHRARGTAADVGAAQRAINEQIAEWYPDATSEWYPDATSEPDGIGFVQRIVP